jgi:hypothetical protein
MKNEGRSPEMRNHRIKLWLKRFYIAFAVLIMSSVLLSEYERLKGSGYFDHIRSQEVSYPEFMKKLRAGNITVIEISRTRIYGYLKHPAGHLIAAPTPTHPSARDRLAKELRDRKIAHRTG